MAGRFRQRRAEMSPRDGRRLAVVTYFLLVVACRWTAVGAPPSGEEPKVAPVAAVQTEPVPSKGDAADDPAIWIHPTDPTVSMVMGTDKKGGLNGFDLDGKR